MDFERECPQNPVVPLSTPGGQKEEKNLRPKRIYPFLSVYRLKNRHRISALRRYGYFYNAGELKFKYLLDSGQSFTEMLISVRKKYGNSPQRNHAKRLIREYFRLNPIKNHKGLFFSVSVISTEKPITANVVKQAFIKFITYIENEIG